MSDRDHDVEMDAVGPDVFTYNKMVSMVREKTSTSARLMHAPPSLVMLAGTMLGLLVRDVVLSRDEVAGLSANLLVSNSAEPPPGRIHLVRLAGQKWTQLGVGSTPTKWRGTTGRVGMSV